MTKGIQHFVVQLKPHQHLPVWPRDTLSSDCYFDFGHDNLNSAVTDRPSHSKSKELVKCDEPPKEDQRC